MYRYDEFDHTFVRERVAQFRDQVTRRLRGDLSGDEFRPLRLMNGLYAQLHAYMLRVAIPYGTLSSRQMRMLAHLARTYDKGYGHFTTRQNIQYNWPKLEDVPDMLADLARVEMHAIQTSGNCIRNVTADQYAGASADEVADSRIYAEILRQWSTLHPEFSFLPRKFKIAVTASQGRDRTAVRFHDIGVRVHRNGVDELGFEMMAGGGLGRTPMIGHTLNEFVPEADLLSYCEAILRVYNQLGRRDNLFKARIKILVHEVGAKEFTRMVEEEWAHVRDGALRLPDDEVERIRAYFSPPPHAGLPAESARLDAVLLSDPVFAAWHAQNVAAHKQPGYAIVTVSLKPEGAFRETSPPTKWTPSPIWLSATASTKSASLTNRTSCSPMCARTSSTRCGRSWANSGSPRPTSRCSPTSSVARASTTAGSQRHARSRWRSASPGALTT